MQQIIKSNNISFDIDILKECISELSPIDDREEFFNCLVSNRLEICNKRCIEEFNNQLNMIERKLDPDNVNLNKLSRAIKSMSKLSSSLYKTQITLYKVL